MWTLTFKDIDNATITVEIEGGNGTLTGAAEPLITRELETDDPFEPVRYQTGYINLVGTDGADIRPTDTFDRPVRIRKNGQVVWLGYIAVEEWNNSMSEYPQTVQLPLISALGVLDYVEYEAELQSATVGGVLYKALNMARTSWRMVYFGQHDYSVFNNQFVEYAFKKNDSKSRKKYKGINPDLQKRKEAYTALDVVREICKVHGWQAREDGQNIWFTTPDVGMQVQTISYGALSHPTSSGPYSGSSQTLYPTSMAQSRSMLPARNQVRITADLDPMPDEIMSLQNIIDRLEYKGEKSHIPPQVSQTDSVQSYLADVFYLNSDVIQLSNYSENLITDNIYARKWDDEHMKTFGTLIARDVYYKYNIWDKNRLPEVSPCLTAAYRYGNDAAILLSEHYYYFNSMGYIDLEVEADAISYDWEKIDYQDGTNSANVSVYLGFGNQWFNGTAWQSTKTAFVPRPENTATSSRPWRHNCKGFAVPLPSGYGRFTIILQGVASQQSTIKYYRYRIVSLTLRPITIRSGITDYDELRYNALCNTLARDSYEVDHNLYFEAQGTETNVLSYRRITYDASKANPIESLLSRMQTWYSKAHMRLQVDSRGTDFKPMDTASLNSYNCIIGARQVNWRDNETRLTLYSK